MELKKTPYKAFILSNEGLLKSLFDEELTSSNRQTLPTAYYPNGAMYIFLLSEFIKNGNFPSNGSLPFIMTEYESIDIDTEDDFVMMEKLCIQY
jgi:CMP-N-acetylneuraminic acid synthetase